MLIPLTYLVYCADCRGVFDFREHHACPGCGTDGEGLWSIARWLDRAEGEKTEEAERGSA
jgi:rRNA maturation endonuclease Nob1